MFNPEFLNRLDDVIVFHPLSKEHIAQIVAILLQDVQKPADGGGARRSRLTDAATRLPGQARLRRELRRAAAQARDPEVHRGSALREDPARRVREGRRDRSGRRRRRRQLEFRVLTGLPDRFLRPLTAERPSDPLEGHSAVSRVSLENVSRLFRSTRTARRPRATRRPCASGPSAPVPSPDSIAFSGNSRRLAQHASSRMPA